MIKIEYIKVHERWEFPTDGLENKDFWTIATPSGKPQVILEGEYIHIPQMDFDVQNMLEAVANLSVKLMAESHGLADPRLLMFFNEERTKFGILGYDNNHYWVRT